MFHIQEHKMSIRTILEQDWTIMRYSPVAAAEAAAAVIPTVKTFKHNDRCKPDIVYTYSNLSVYNI